MTSLKWVSSTDMPSIARKPCRFNSFGIGLRNPHRLHAEGRLARVFAGQIGLAAVASDDEQMAEHQLMRRRRPRHGS